jgi:Rrf2 family transcriptional regulator, cysteine metabolism repressor
MELALNFEKGPLQLRLIAERQDISVKYLEQLMSVLMSGGFVRSVRGARGGYMLARDPDTVRVSEIFHCLEGKVATVDCVEDSQVCPRSSGCSARKLWQAVEKAIEDTLSSYTLKNLIDMGEQADSANYQI